MQALVYRDGRILAVPEPQKDEPVVYGGYDEQGDFVGYAMPGAGPGFQDTIALLYGYLPHDKKVVGMEILESRETPGLGDKIYKDADFVAEFSDLSVEPEIVAVKKGTGTLDNHVDAITGATISAKAVVRIINETHVAWTEQLPAPGTEPPFAGDDADSGTGQ
jgi:electron transport complex protein RnfG